MQSRVDVECRCPMCGAITSVTITEYELYRIRYTRDHIQDILPHRTPQERELLLSGYCKDCQSLIFG